VKEKDTLGYDGLALELIFKSPKNFISPENLGKILRDIMEHEKSK